MKQINDTYQDILLAPGYSLGRVQELINSKNPEDKPKVAKFIKCRLSSKYLFPFENQDKDEKSGFAMMACYCLLIETLQAFREGKDQTERQQNGCAFCHFLEMKQKIPSEYLKI